MTILHARDKGLFALPEGQVLAVVGSAGSAATVRRVDPSIGGLNYLETWTITDSAPATIGAFSGPQQLLVICTSGRLVVKAQDAVLTQSGGAITATITGTGVVGSPLTATLPAGYVGTLQFTRSTKAATPVKTLISGAVANAVNSLSYTPVSGDTAYNIGCDTSNVVASSATVSVSAAGSSDVAPAVLTAAAITGAPQQGVPLAITSATFSGSPTPTATRVIKMDGAQVAAGNQTTGYTPQLADVGKIPSVSDTASNGVGSAVTSTGAGSVISAADSIPSFIPQAVASGAVSSAAI